MNVETLTIKSKLMHSRLLCNELVNDSFLHQLSKVLNVNYIYVTSNKLTSLQDSIYSSIISWCENEKAVVIHDEGRLSREVLPLFESCQFLPLFIQRVTTYLSILI